MILLLDVGNTRLKFACWNRENTESAVLSEQEAIVHFGHFPPVFDDIQDYVQNKAQGDIQQNALNSEATSHRRLTRILVSCVAGKLAEQSIKESCQRCFGLDPEFARTQKKHRGLKIVYERAERLGVDRWLAILAAKSSLSLKKAPVCVVDSGSALTIDVVSAKGDHQGGFIIPGLRLMYDSLLKGTQEIYADKPAFHELDWGKDTNEAVSRGALFAIVATVNESYRRFKEQENDAHLVLTGGDANLLIPYLDDANTCKNIPELVLFGLLEYFEVLETS